MISRNQLINKKEQIIDLCKVYQVKRLYLFGSLASDKMNDESDIDFLISFDENLEVSDYSNNYFTIHEKLESLLNEKIDLITESSLQNPYFIESLNANKVLFYGSES